MPRCLVAAVLLVVTIAIAAPAGAQSDVSGGKDHPLLKRYEGAHIIGYEQKAFTDFEVPLARMNDYGEGPSETATVEGRHTRIVYVAPAGRSTLEVFRNYRNELADLGFETRFECAQGDCSVNQGAALATHYLYKLGRRLDTEGQRSEMAFSRPKEPRYMSARLSQPGKGDVWVSVYVAQEGFDHFEETANKSLVLLDIIEEEAMEERMVVVPADEMAEDIHGKGSVALYGIHFDTDSTTIKPESRPTLEEIAKLLKDDPDLALYVVGHTDSQGGYDYNMDLSGRRAVAVVVALANEYGIDRGRLDAAGVGFLAPVASNDTDDGRARNRRVELVKR